MGREQLMQYAFSSRILTLRFCVVRCVAMGSLLRGFTDELVKTGGVTELVERAVGQPGSALRKAIARAAALGATTTATQTLVQPHEAGEKQHLLRNALAGAAAGAVTGRAFPGWFARSQMRAVE
jgi:hypothetical protein